MEPGVYYLLFIIWALDLSRLYLFWRQYRIIYSTTIPPPHLTGYIDSITFAEARESMMQKASMAMLSIVFRVCARTYKILTFGCAVAWAATWDIAGTTSSRAVAYNVLALFSARAPLIPLSAAVGVMSGHRTVNQAFHQMITEIFFLFVHGLVTAMLTMLLINMTDSYSGLLFLILFPISTAIGAIFTVLYVNIIVPQIHDKLSSGPLYERLRLITDRLRFPDEKIYVERISTTDIIDTNSDITNAYYCGILGANMVLLSQKLVNEFSEDEVAAVISHELGHWYCKHTSIYFGLTALELFLICNLLMWSYGNEWLFRVFGFDLIKDPPHPIIGVFIFVTMLFPLFKQISTMATGQISRYCEFEADRFAVRLGEADHLKRALLKITAKNNAFPVYDPHYSNVLLTHPPVLERLAHIDDSQNM
ncbi:CAAX prenyl protease 1 homolog [Cimex lectularius]|uniref:Peptidase M48 domain-containing protein n=1 Tax=Cimex lectularius TaxID=79782 RepID=A0A8I6S8L5_CIMLE|nr:CAAX prenyl protease 1 homolog [Cimex lectularius]